MTETNEIIADAVAETEAVEAVEVEQQADNDEQEATEESTEEAEEQAEDGDDNGEFPKKAVNALNRKTKQLNKARASLQESNAKIKELEAKLNALNTQQEEIKPVNADDFTTLDEYWDAKMDALVKQQLQQANSENEKAQLTQEQKRLTEERDSYIAQQAQEVSQSIPDFTQTIQPYLQVMDSLPNEVVDIFYSMENAPLAAYVLAKEGKLGQLPYANPYVAAAEIMSAHERGKAMLSKPRTQISSAPEPMKSAKGQVKTTKNLMEGSVLKNLGLKS